jgi:hypothetical protein
MQRQNFFNEKIPWIQKTFNKWAVNKCANYSLGGRQRYFGNMKTSVDGSQQKIETCKKAFPTFR